MTTTSSSSVLKNLQKQEIGRQQLHFPEATLSVIMSMLSNGPATPTLTKYDVVPLTALSLMLLLKLAKLRRTWS
jgi:hypothetical protein